LLVLERDIQVLLHVLLQLLLVIYIHFLGAVIVIAALVLHDLVDLDVLVRRCDLGDLAFEEQEDLGNVVFFNLANRDVEVL